MCVFELHTDDRIYTSILNMHSNIMYLGREIVNKERTVKLLLLCIGDDVVVLQHYDETR